MPGELAETAGRAAGAGIVVPVAAGAYRWVVAKLGGYFYIRSRVWLVASVLALPAVIFDIYGWVAVLLALPVWFLDQLRTYGSSRTGNETQEADVSG
ncbi:MAG: hypothetical protein ABEH58_06135 [Haloplanus sp.]